ncbi:STN domain-containing protein [Planctomycetales bacterium 10988]|nr:STN domain-containing protein [Planctomycetales bacterium 10988]
MIMMMRLDLRTLKIPLVLVCIGSLTVAGWAEEEHTSRRVAYQQETQQESDEDLILPPTVVEGEQEEVEQGESQEGETQQFFPPTPPPNFSPSIPPSFPQQAQGPRFNPSIDFRSDQSSAGMNVPAPLVETPRTVNVLTEGFLDSINVQDLQDTLTYVPGASSGGRDSPAFNIRGFGGFSIGNPEENVIFIDNFRTAGRRYHYDPSLYDQVEILKGPASLLYGTATPGGVVRFISKRPEYEESRVIEATLGNFDHSRAMLDLTGPMNEQETAAYRFITTGFQANITSHGSNDDIGRYDRFIASPSASWKTPLDGELYVSYEYSNHNEPQDFGTKALMDGTILYNSDPFYGPASFVNREHNIGTIEFRLPLDEGWEFFIGGRAGRSNIDGLWDFASGVDDGSGINDRFVRRFSEDYDQQEARAQITGEFWTGDYVEHFLTIGVSHLRNEALSSRQTGFVPGALDFPHPEFGDLPALGPPISFSLGGIKERAVYLQDYMTIGERLFVFGGLRYMNAEFVAYPEDGADETVDYAIGGVYHVNDLINPFVAYSTALTPQFGRLSPTEPIPFRDGKQIEAGIKSELFNKRLLTTASVFNIEQTNIAQPNIPDDGFLTLLGDQATTGFEFEAVGQLGENFNLYGGYSYLDAEFTTNTAGLQGLTPINVPQNKFAFFLEYLGFTGHLKGWRPGVGFVSETGRWGDNENTFALPDFARVDLSLAYDCPCQNYYFRINLENVFDTNYVDSADTVGYIIQGAPRYLTMRGGLHF